MLFSKASEKVFITREREWSTVSKAANKSKIMCIEIDYYIQIYLLYFKRYYIFIFET